MRRAARVGTLTLIAVAAVNGQAQATTVSTTETPRGRVVVVTGDARDNRIAFGVRPGGEPAGANVDLEIWDHAAGPENPIQVPAGTKLCVQSNDQAAFCKISAPDVSFLHGIQVSGEAGDDSVITEGLTESSYLEMTLAGGPGNDVLTFGAFGGSASGGDGDDVISSSAYGNRVDAGTGNDVVVGGWGDDEIQLGPGQDRVITRSGRDTVFAQDGEADAVDCGGDVDTARVDQRDAVSGCETAGVIVTPDADGDGIAPPTDCDDADAAVKPGQNEIPGNGRDDDCAGGDAAVTTIVRGALVSSFNVRSTYTRVARLALRSLEPGVAVQLRCRGRGCPFGRRAVQAPKRGGTLTLSGSVHRARFRGGATLEVWISKPGAVGKVIRISFRRHRNPNGLQLCLQPGARTPSAC